MTKEEKPVIPFTGYPFRVLLNIRYCCQKGINRKYVLKPTDKAVSVPSNL